MTNDGYRRRHTTARRKGVKKGVVSMVKIRVFVFFLLFIIFIGLPFYDSFSSINEVTSQRGQTTQDQANEIITTLLGDSIISCYNSDQIE